MRIVAREFVQGIILGSFLAAIGFVAALVIHGDAYQALTVPVTIMLVVMCGTMLGAILPLLFQRLGWDPAIMSTPFIAGIIDLVGIVIYMSVAIAMGAAAASGG